jgi:hypothetical protein
MTDETRRLFATASHLVLRIHLNAQAILANLQRNIPSTGDGGRINQPLLSKSLLDLRSCLNEFMEITKIDMQQASEALNGSFRALDEGDLDSLYKGIQEFYRDGILGTLLELSQQ